MVNEREEVIYNGPWFSSYVRLFTHPWHQTFDPYTKIISTIIIWVNILNLPLHF